MTIKQAFRLAELMSELRPPPNDFTGCELHDTVVEEMGAFLSDVTRFQLDPDEWIERATRAPE